MNDAGEKDENRPVEGQSVLTSSSGPGMVGLGEQIGRYKFLRILGEEGFGIVYLAGSDILNAKVSLVLDDNFKPGFRIELHMKDLANASDTRHSVGVPVPLTGGVTEIMQALKVDGKAGHDHSGIIQYYEKLAKTEVRRAK